MALPQKLCSPCRLIVDGFPRIFEDFQKRSSVQTEEASTTTTPWPLKIADLGTRIKSKQNLACGLCWTLRSACTSYRGGKRDVVMDRAKFDRLDMSAHTEDNTDVLWACPFLECMSEDIDYYDDGVNGNSALGGSDFLVLAIFPSHYMPKGSHEMMKPFVWEPTCFTALLDLSVAEQLPYRPRSVPASFDSAVISKWLRACEVLHEKSSCRLSPPVDLEITLIDCITRRLCASRASLPYVALSYVWGSRASKSSYVAGMFLRPEIPAVVVDAMAVALGLGLRYLWVDQYCINQEDDVAKQHQIANMGTIYKQAKLTIVASCGSDATYGLPGVGDRPRKSSQEFRHGNFSITTFESPLSNAPERSVWNTRGWTLQEAWLSQRILCFTDSQCYWECRGTCISEGLDQHEQVWKQRLIDEPQKCLSIGPRSRNPYTRLRSDTQQLAHYFYTMTRWMEQYTVRKLLYDTDVLAAVAGVLSAAHNDIFTPEDLRDRILPTNLVGLPVFLGRSEDDPVRQITLITALSWHHDDETDTRPDWPWHAHRPWPQRHRGFPSWTWAGWKGRAGSDSGWVQWDRVWETDFCIQDVHFVDDGVCPNTRIAIADMQPFQRATKLRFRAPEIPPGWLSFTIDYRNGSATDDNDDAHFWCSLKDRKVKFYPSEQALSPALILTYLHSGLCRLVLMGFIKRRKGLVWLVRRERDTLVRSGVLTWGGGSSLLHVPAHTTNDCEDDEDGEGLSETLESHVSTAPRVDWEIS